MGVQPVSAESERAAVVAWLRNGIRRSVPTMDPTWSAAFNAGIDYVADAIERGDHHIGLVTDDPEHRLSGDAEQIAAADHGAGSRSSDGSGTSRDHLKGQSYG